MAEVSQSPSQKYKFSAISTASLSGQSSYYFYIFEGIIWSLS